MLKITSAHESGDLFPKAGGGTVTEVRVCWINVPNKVHRYASLEEMEPVGRVYVPIRGDVCCGNDDRTICGGDFDCQYVGFKAIECGVLNGLFD